MDISVVSAAIGHTNVLSTRNAFGRLKKKWDLGNIPTKTSGAGAGGGKSGQKTDEDGSSGQGLSFPIPSNIIFGSIANKNTDDVLKPQTSNGAKVVKKRACAAPKPKASKAAPKTEEDADVVESEVASEDDA